MSEIRARSGQLRTQREGAKKGEVADSLAALDTALATIESGSPGAAAANLVRLNGDLATLLDIVEGADAEPTSQTVAATGELEKSLEVLLNQWGELRRTRFTTR